MAYFKRGRFSYNNPFEFTKNTGDILIKFKNFISVLNMLKTYKIKIDNLKITNKRHAIQKDGYDSGEAFDPDQKGI